MAQDDLTIANAELVREIDAETYAGRRSRMTLCRLADRGDWRLRLLAVSALGRLARRERHRTGVAAATADAVARIPFLRRYLPTVASNGRLVVGTVLNATATPAFIVRTAAALALGECGGTDVVPALTQLAKDPFGVVRRAAAVALRANGVAVDDRDLDDTSASATPVEIAADETTHWWLTRLAERHRSLFDEARGLHGLPGSSSADDDATWLAGRTQALGTGGTAPEMARYVDEPNLDHQADKPFGSLDRADNIRQLDAFIALAANLDVPRGAAVVDLGGGSGWAGELLSRFGFVPIVADVSLPLLRLAKRRFDGTRPGHVTVADMTALPLRDASVAAVLAIDALHHVEDLDGVLREAYRVLAPGGSLLLAEPGEGHSESPKSLSEAREYGVRESDIDPLRIARLARRAGFGRVEILPRIPPTARMSVSALPSAMRRPVESWTVEDGGAIARFDAVAVHCMLARPLMRLAKGAARYDTRAPHVLRAEIAPEIDRRGDALSGHVAVTNTGDTDWNEGGRDPGAVHLGIQLLDREGRLVDRDLARVPLPRRISSGERCDVTFRVGLPDAEAPYRVKFDLVAEHVCWFEDRGSQPTYRDV